VIESHTSVLPPARPVPEHGQRAVPRLPVTARAGRLLVLAGVFVCAACGLVYELELVALATYLIGDSVTQTSVVVSLMVFAMGAGSLAAKRMRPRAALGFGAVEAALALVGGCSAMGLYAAFAWLDGPCGVGVDGIRVLLALFSLAIGVLVGAEVPLLMVLIQRVRRQDPGIAVADLFAADYVGALVGGLAFPFLLLPLLGQLTGALLTGAVNALAGPALVLGLFRQDMPARHRRLLVVAGVSVLAVLGVCAALAADFERAARHAVYGDDVRVAVHTDGEDVVLTGGPRGPFKLFLDGRLWLRSGDEPRHHHGLVSPVNAGPRASVLVLGGGDGLAAHEALRGPGVARVDIIAPGPALASLARTDPALAALNGHALRDPRVHLTVADPLGRLRGLHRRYDVVVSDLPGPGRTTGARYYSQEFYGLVGRALAPGGRLVVRAGTPVARGSQFWTVDATLRAAGLHTVPYCVGPWGFVLAAHGREVPPGAADASQRAASGAARGAGGRAARGTPGARGGARTPGDAGDLPRLWARACSGTGDGARDLTGLRPPGTAPSTLVHPRYGG
jgi:spermidine synthase